jgi:hypothetical protein
MAEQIDTQRSFVKAHLTKESTIDYEMTRL